MKIDDKTGNPTHISDLTNSVMMVPENYCRIMVAGLKMTSLLIINLNLLKIQKL